MLAHTGRDRREHLGGRFGAVVKSSGEQTCPVVLLRGTEADRQRLDRRAQIVCRQPDVERREMESERPYLAQQPRERPIGNPPRARRFSEQLQIGFELRRLAIAMRQSPERAVDPRRHERKLPPERLLTGCSAAGRRHRAFRRRPPRARRPARGRRTVAASAWEDRSASLSTRARSSRSAVLRCSPSVRPTDSGVTSGLPSMSPPAQLPNRTAGTLGGHDRSNEREISASSRGATSNSTASKKNRIRRTSSSTTGRMRRTASVCHHTVSTSRNSPSNPRRWVRPSRGSSSRSIARHTDCWWSNTERRVASVGCAVIVNRTSSRRSASATSAGGYWTAMPAAAASDSRCGALVSES